MVDKGGSEVIIDNIDGAIEKTMIEKEVIGMTKEAAIEAVKAKGFKVRVRSEDGVPFMGTCDYRTDRVNLNITKGIVTGASLG